MKKINSIDELQKSIDLLEARQVSEVVILKDEVNSIFEGLKPANLIKSTVNELANSSNFKGNIIEISLNLATGYLTKKVIIGDSPSPLQKSLANLLQIGISRIILNNINTIESYTSNVISNVLSKDQTSS